MKVENFFDAATSTLTYIVFDEKTHDAVVIDPVLNFNPSSGKVSYESVDKLVTTVKELKLNLHAILETHVHADHLSGAQKLKEHFKTCKLVIGEKIKLVQATFKSVFNLTELKTDGSQFDYLIKDNESVNFGSLKVKAISTPGHTPACISYLIEDALFCGDAIFMPDYGTGRCDFPNGDASTLFDSITQKIFTLPAETKVYVGHDYQPNNRKLEFMTTIQLQKSENIHLKSNSTKEAFKKFREARDKTLDTPKLLIPSIQVNIAAGNLPKAEANGTSYLKWPLVILN